MLGFVVLWYSLKNEFLIWFFVIAIIIIIIMLLMKISRIIMIIILGQKTRPYNNQQKKKKIGKTVNIAVPADHRIKLKECEKKDKYFDLARELKKLWNMKVMNVPTVIGAFGTVTKELLKGLEDLEEETIQMTALLKMAKILRRVQETWGDLLLLNLQWKTIS